MTRIESKSGMLVGLAVLSLWLMNIVFGFIFNGITYYDFTAKIAVIAGASALAMTLPLILFRITDYVEQNGHPRSSIKHTTRFFLCILCVLGYAIEMRAYGRSFGESLDAVRAEYLKNSASELQAGKIVYIAYLLKGFGIIAWMMTLMDSPKLKHIIPVLGLLGLAVVIEAYSTGGRALFRLLIITGVGTIFCHHTNWVIRNLRKLALSGSAFVVAAFVAHEAFQDARRGSGALDASQNYENERIGQLVLASVGFESAPLWLVRFVCQPFLYIGTSISNFALFYDNWDGSTMFGTFSFPIVGSRFSSEHPSTVKQRVDEYNAAYGAEHNLWATGLRDICIDLSPYGIVVGCFVIGIAFIVLRRTYARYLGIRLLCIFAASWMLYSPLESLTRLGIEVSIYLSFLILLSEVFSSKLIRFESTTHENKVRDGNGNPSLS
jgi:hypothetical protein